MPIGKATLAQIKLRALDYCDIPADSGWVTDARLTDVANDGLSDLHYQLVIANEDYLTVQTALNGQVGDDHLTLPDDFFKLRALYLIDSGTRFKLSPFEFSDLNVSQVTATSSRPRYRVTGQRLNLFPSLMIPAALEVWYVRQFRDIYDDAKEIDPSLPHGWDCYVVGHVAEYLLQRKETDPTPATRYKLEALEMIKQAVVDRDASGPKLCKDTSERFRYRRWFPYPRKP